MKPKRFVHVGFNFGGAEANPPIDELQKVFSDAPDWLRYHSHCWILYTSVDLQVWRDRIRNVPGLPKDASFFLVEFTAAYNGFMHKWVWEWFSKNRS